MNEQTRAAIEAAIVSTARAFSRDLRNGRVLRVLEGAERLAFYGLQLDDAAESPHGENSEASQAVPPAGTPADAGATPASAVSSALPPAAPGTGPAAPILVAPGFTVSAAPEPAAPAVAPAPAAARVPGAGFGATPPAAPQHAMPGDPCPRCGAAPTEPHRIRGCKPRVGGPLP